ncbi:alpha/beta fold hydrolase [Sphingomonas sp. PB2P12]|uniref:alpha/beta hydrolase n=1 Tax=Sphingomonas sandaracina TaxID=3096157 RepID=UPI002FC7491C
MFLAMLRSETATSPERMARALAGLRAYQAAPRERRRDPMPAVHRVGRVSLRDYGGSGRPVVFVPSLINPPDILDHSAETSLLRWIATQGFRVWLVDWGSPDSADRDLDLTAHVAQLLVPLLGALPEAPVLVGYCLGGTLAFGAAAITPVAGVATIAAPWHFAGYGEGRSTLAATWAAVQPAAAMLGFLPMEVLQAGFWQLDPSRTIAKYEAFADLAPDSDAAHAFVRLEDWANAGAPLPYAAAASLFEDWIADDLPGKGRWSIAGTAVDPLALACPTVEFVSLTDRIVPAATAIGLADRRDLGAGHVGMIVGRRARAQLWEPLANWIAALA